MILDLALIFLLLAIAAIAHRQTKKDGAVFEDHGRERLGMRR